MPAISRALALAALWRASAALMVADSSPCASNCGNVLDATTDDMIACPSGSYGASSEGQVFQSCVGCESTSTYSTTKGQQNVSDLQYMLYNLRYATNLCLFDAGVNPCVTSFACGHIKEAIQYGNLSSSVSAYGYCSVWTEYLIDKCHACLDATTEGHYLSNFISVLSGACRLQLEPPATLPLQGNIFSTDTVNVTDPTPTATFTPPPAGALDSGAIAGIVVGGLVVVLTIIGCGVVINGKRRRKAYLRRREELSKNWPSQQGGGGSNGGGEMFETPISQRPLRGWEDSPISSAATQTTFPPYFSPYSSQYNSPVSGAEGGGGGGGVGYHAAWPAEKTQNIGVALSPEQHEEAAAPFWGDKKGKDRVDVEREGYELQEGVNSAGGYGFPIPPPPPPAQAPTLGHPGYGRHGFAPQQYGRGDAEGNAI